MTEATEPPPARLPEWLTAGSDLAFAGVVLAIGLVLRVAVVLLAIRTGRTELQWDEIYIARRMADGLGFSFDYYARLPASAGPSAFFPPGYVYNVYWLLKLFHTTMAAAWENAALSLGVCVLLFFLARRLFDRPTARVTLLLAAFYPPFLTRIPHGGVVFPKMILMVPLVMVMLRLWEKRGALAAALAGLFAGLLALMMPDAVLFVAGFAALLVLVPPSGWVAVRAAGVMLAVTALVIAPWTIRNWTCFHRFCLVSANGGFNFYMGNRPGTTNEVEIDAIVDLDRRLDGEMSRADELDREKILYREGVRWMREHPRDAAVALLDRVALHWSFRPANFKDMGLVRGVSATSDWVYFAYNWSYAIAYFVVLALAVPGLWRTRRRWGEFAPIFLAFLYSTFVAALFVVQSKMRLMKVDPFLLVFAAAFVVDLLSRGREGSGRTPESVP